MTLGDTWRRLAVELEVRLTPLLEMRGLVTGDSGSGKNCSATRVLAQLHSSLYRVFHVCLSTGTVLDLHTAYAGPLHREKALTAGFDRQVSKPVVPAELLAQAVLLAPARHSPA